VLRWSATVVSVRMGGSGRMPQMPVAGRAEQFTRRAVRTFIGPRPGASGAAPVLATRASLSGALRAGETASLALASVRPQRAGQEPPVVLCCTKRGAGGVHPASLSFALRRREAAVR